MIFAAIGRIDVRVEIARPGAVSPPYPLRPRDFTSLA
jgi:hypothetical protein